MKIRKFRAGDMVESASDSEEDKAKTAGLAASNAEKKSSGFLGLGRLFQGNIDEKGSEAYNKYGAGYGREVEAENDRLKAASKPAAPAASAPAASASAPAAPFKSTAAANAAASAARAAAMAREAKAASDKDDTAAETKMVRRNLSVPNAAGPSTTPDARDGGARDSSRFKKPAAKAPAPAAKAPAPAAKTTSPTQRDGREEDKAPAAAKAPADSRTAEAGNSRGSRPAAAPAPTAKAPAAKAPEAAKQLSPAQQKAKDAIARATGNSSSSRVPTPEEAEQNRASFAGKAGDAVSSVGNYFKNFETPADRRSRLAKETKDKERSKFMKESGQKAKGGAIRGYASGGSVSASRRGDGIAQRGKTRGKMC
jgi:hypothetical protein